MSDSSSAKLLNRVRSLLERGERISTEDCRRLFEVKDLLALARLARIPRERRYGRRAFFRPARVVEYRGEAPELFVSEAATTAPEGTSELIIRCRFRAGESLHVWRDRLVAFGQGELRTVAQIPPRMIAELADAEGISIADILTALSGAGAIFIDGAEAELFDRETRATLSPGALAADRWLAVHRAAHEIGLKTGAAFCYATHDLPVAYAEHLDVVRSEQDRSGGFVQFVPMAIHNRNVDDFYLAAPTAAQSLRALAIARIFLDNVLHIAAAPSLVTSEVAYVGLSYGADLIDVSVLPADVVAQERREGAAIPLPVLEQESAELSSVGLPVGQVRSRIAEARWTPVPVNATFEPESTPEARII